MKLKLLFLFSVTLIYSKSFSQWNGNPAVNNPVSTVVQNQQEPYIVTDGKNGGIICWIDSRDTLNNDDVYVQRMDANGFPKWTLNGVAVCTDTGKQTVPKIAETNTGGAIITWHDTRSGDKDIYAQKVDSMGNVMWTTNGVGVCIKAGNQQNPQIISDMHGGAIIVWEDSTTTNNSFDIYAQRIDSLGNILWGTAGVSICTQPYTQLNPKIKPDGVGGGLICWQDKRFGLSNYVYSQRIDDIGDIYWTTDGVQVCAWGGGQTNPKIGCDGAQGEIVVWQDKRNGNYDIYAQRLNASGALMWNINAVPVCGYLGNQSAIDIATDGINGAIVVWKDLRTFNYQIYINNITASGVVTWNTTGGMLLGLGENPNIVADGFGGAIVTWQDSISSGGTWDVWSQRLDSTGVKKWTLTGEPTCIANGGQTNPKQVATGDGGAIFCWADKRNTFDADIYAFHLFSNGSHQGIDELNGKDNSIVCYPNPFSSQTTIRINSSDYISSWQLMVYDINGKLVRTETITNSNQVIFNSKDLNEGIYFYQGINKNQLIGSGKFVITK